ncbi:MAG: SprT-like domain-containing protein [SAR324 cluster bacterium]|nr:SprT-like domain-containing protein [SAR324 cluster bacterium]MBF0351859.1 SprT-like domain-containing protein [SAR324 cluster bacterium]
MAEAERLLREHWLWQRGWRFELDNARRRAGNCRYRAKKITMSRGFVRSAGNVEITDTLLHEIAHALVGPSHGHDNVWRAKAQELGCSGERCHSVEFSQSPYFKKCVNGCWQLPAFRRNRAIHRYRCKYCDGKVVYIANSA